jgi:hypothetical protein
MSRRILESLAVAIAVVSLIGLLRIAPAAGPAQTASGEAAAPSGPAPTTPWGEPDLQGIWTRDSEVPLNRPSRFANQEFFTDEQRAELDKQRIEAVSRDHDPERRKQAGIVDVGGAYNAAIYTSHLRLGKRTSLIVDPPNGQIPPLTPEEQARRKQFRAFQLALLQYTEVCKLNMQACTGGKHVEPKGDVWNIKPPFYLRGAQGGIGSGAGIVSRSDGPEDRGHSERCMSAALPDFGGYRRIVQSPGKVSIYYDTGQGQGWARVIPITDAPHAPANVKLWWGDSRAKWDGKTLVVDVTNFSEKSNYQGAGEKLHLVEKWTRLDADTVQYEVTVEDPTVWTRPWTAKQELKRQSETENRIYYEPRCHEGNYGMASLLAGARQDEQLFKAGKAPHPATKCLGACGGFSGGFADEGEDANPLR